MQGVLFYFLLGVSLSLWAAQRGAQPVAVIIEDTGDRISLYQESHALIVGVSQYKYWPTLPGVTEDVKAVSEALKKHGFNVEVIEDPDHESLESAFEDFILRYGRQSQNRLVFYFAGHGYTEKPPWATDNPEEWLGYIVSRDAPLPSIDETGLLGQAMSMKRFEELALKIRSKHALFIFDSCFSGSVFSLTRSVPSAISRRTAEPVRQFLTSGSADQEVPDVSVFRREFIVALEGGGDLTGDGYVTATELGMYLEEKVSNYTWNTQTPQFGKIRHRQLDKGDFVFVAGGTTSLEQQPGAQMPPPPPPVALTGNLQVNVNVPAKIYIGNQSVGDAAPGKPLNRTGVPSGEIEVRVEAPGHEVARQRADVKKGEWTQLVFELRAAKTPQTVVAGSLFRDRLRRGGEGPKMVVIAAGSVRMGSPENEQGRFEDEGPLRTVTMRDAVAIGRNEVTVGEFGAFVQDTSYRTEAAGCNTWIGKELIFDESKNWRNPGFAQTDNHPVVCVSWRDAYRYAAWLSEQTGKRYRLPTEAEWEYAARAGTVTSRYWGNDPHQACEYANVADQTTEQQFSDRIIHQCRDGYVYTAPVESFKPNRYGLHDMLGNAWEWVEDCYHDSYQDLPLDGGARLNGDCAQRVIRGGAWYGGPRYIRSAKRIGIDSADRGHLVGFRLAQDIEQ